MTTEFLSEEEVDALLTGVDGVIDGTEAPEPAGAIQPFDLSKQDLSFQEPMPAVETVNERFRGLLRIALLDFMGRVPQVAAGPIRAIKYADFTASLQMSANLNVVQVKPLRGNALVVLDAALIYLVIDNLFGGEGRFQPRVEGRDSTPTEQGIIERVRKVILGEYEKSWKDLYPLSFELVRSESDLQFVNIASPDDTVIAMTFTIESGVGCGAFHICIPCTMLEPIRDRMRGNVETKERPEPDRRWVQTLSTQVQAAEVELVVDLVTLPVTVKQLLSMTVGDILSAEIPQMVTAQVDGIPLFDCRFGSLNGQYALKIASARRPESETPAGELHA